MNAAANGLVVIVNQLRRASKPAQENLLTHAVWLGDNYRKSVADMASAKLQTVRDRLTTCSTQEICCQAWMDAYMQYKALQVLVEQCDVLKERLNDALLQPGLSVRDKVSCVAEVVSRYTDVECDVHALETTVGKIKPSETAPWCPVQVPPRPQIGQTITVFPSGGHHFWTNRIELDAKFSPGCVPTELCVVYRSPYACRLDAIATFRTLLLPHHPHDNPPHMTAKVSLVSRMNRHTPVRIEVTIDFAPPVHLESEPAAP